MSLGFFQPIIVKSKSGLFDQPLAPSFLFIVFSRVFVCTNQPQNAECYKEHLLCKWGMGKYIETINIILDGRNAKGRLNFKFNNCI
jgi:hypothetical protein